MNILIMPLDHKKANFNGCKYLTRENVCRIFGKAERPKVCRDFKACEWICGKGAEAALKILTELEIETK